MAGGLEILLAKGKPSKDEMPKDEEEMAMGDSPKEEEKSASLEDEFFSDAFEAVKNDDKDAFMEALKSGIKACYGSEEK